MSIELILWSCALVFAYAVLANRLLRFSQPLKLRAVEIAGELARDPRLSNERKLEIQRIIPLISTRRLAWMFAVGVSVTFLMILLRGSRHEGPTTGVPAELRKQWSTMITLTMLSAVANSPMAALLFGIQVMGVSFFVSFGKLADVLLLRSAERISGNACAVGPKIA